jgi:uncharacterized protein (TIGR02757 family)
MTDESIKAFLDQKVAEFNQPLFIKDDPVSIPHLFKKKEDIEIAGFFAAIFSWGVRKTIINKSKELMALMGNAPHEFVLHHNDNDLKRVQHFTHRTFNGTDLLYFLAFMRFHYSENVSLETAFTRTGPGVEPMLTGFHDYFFSLPHVPARSRKHIATPARNSSCKRLNMFLRWMVRKDKKAVDFGIWENISPSSLICPIDLHVERVAKRLGLISGKKKGWEAAIELTERLRKYDPLDPVKYDFALFGLGIIEKF